MERGKYIVIEGHDGTGKSTQVQRLITHLQSLNVDAISLEEPGSTPIGQKLRGIIKDNDLKRSPETNLSLFTADRIEAWQQVIEPALKLGEFVVAARNWFSTIAYQGYGENLDINLIEDMTRQCVGPGYLKPDLAILLSNSDELERLSRIATRAGGVEEKDTFESKPAIFQRSVSLGYQGAVRTFADTEIDVAGKSREEVESLIWQIVSLKLIQNGNQKNE